MSNSKCSDNYCKGHIIEGNGKYICIKCGLVQIGDNVIDERPNRSEIYNKDDTINIQNVDNNYSFLRTYYKGYDRNTMRMSSNFEHLHKLLPQLMGISGNVIGNVLNGNSPGLSREQKILISRINSYERCPFPLSAEEKSCLNRYYNDLAGLNNKKQFNTPKRKILLNSMKPNKKIRKKILNF